MSIAAAALMCHAPIVVPVIGGARGGDCAVTTRAMRSVAADVVAQAPDVLVLISPHAPRQRRTWGVSADATLHGDFRRFGHAELSVALPGAPGAARSLAAAASRVELEVTDLPADDLDHGATVPLWFLAEAGLRAPTLLVALPYPGAGSEARFGRLLRDVAAARGERWAVVASGDMSHRLRPGAPGGYHPRAHEFDDAFVAHVRAADYTRAVAPDEALQELAGEDVVQSTAVAVAAVNGAARGARVYAYERPFGVGYMEALLYAEPTPARSHT